MAFEVGQHQHGVIIQDMFADGQFRKPFPAGNGKAYVPVLIHDVDGQKVQPLVLRVSRCPSVVCLGLGYKTLHSTMLLSEYSLESTIRGQNIRTMRFACMQLDGDLPLMP